MKTAVSGVAYAKRSVAERKRWLVITVEVPSDDAKEALAEGLLALGGTSVQDHGAHLTTYVEAPADIESRIREARAALRREVVWRLQDDEDWSEAWKRGLKPRRVGRHFVIAPSWTRPDVRKDDCVIVIDPEMAFGTGEHGTTRGALRFLEQVIEPGMRVLDVGTGSAILAIAAARLGATHVTAIDNDPDALLNAQDNLLRNRTGDVVRLEEGLVDGGYFARKDLAPFDAIVANVLSSVLKPLLPAFYEAARPGGFVILGGILQTESNEMIEACEAAGFTVLSEDLEDEWCGILLRR